MKLKIYRSSYCLGLRRDERGKTTSKQAFDELRPGFEGATPLGTPYGAIKLHFAEYNEVLESVSLLLYFERPAVVVGFLYVFVCIAVVGNPHILSIPVNSFARSNSDIAQ